MKRIGPIKMISSSSILILLITFNLFFISCSNGDNNSESQNDTINSKTQNQLDLIQEPELKNEDPNSNNSPSGEIYESFSVEEKPIFPGGDEGLIKYIVKHTQYPKEARNKGIEGTVYVKFIVTKTGNIGDPSIVRTVDPILELEALRVIKSLPKWTPGKKDGKPVNVWFIVCTPPNPS